ncbi:MAG: cyclic pyranopterin monophosphate synthase MoaC [Acidimicrobiales bacterium]
MEQQRFSHVDSAGKIRMVDVSRKRPTMRVAQASCLVRTVTDAATLHASSADVDPVHGARLAGIQAAKQTANLIPLCHPLNLDQIHVDVEPVATGFAVSSTVVTVNRTGVEMEALTACAFAALSLVTSLFGLDPAARIDDLVLERKRGGKSGEWGRQVDPHA